MRSRNSNPPSGTSLRGGILDRIMPRLTPLEKALKDLELKMQTKQQDNQRPRFGPKGDPL